MKYSTSDLAGRTVERRAAEAVVWGMPAVNYDLMRQAMLDTTEAKENEVVYWSRPVDWRNQKREKLTPNPDALFHDVLQHEGRGVGGDRGSTG